MGTINRLQGDDEGDINVLALVKGNERFIFLYADYQTAECLRQIGRCAVNPELATFSWYAAAVLSQKIRETARGK